MYAEERLTFIADQARAAGRVDVAALASELDVTTETVRRDLTALERRGVLRRVHGGAIPVERLTAEPGLAVRESRHRAEKERIAKTALAELPAEGAVLLDAGSTTVRLAELMPSDRELTVVTNALPVAATLAARANIRLMIIGGRVRGRTLAAVDTWALNSLAGVYVDVAFVGTNGISLERGLTTPDQAEAAVKAAMVGAARRTVVLADHSKVGNDCFARFASLADMDLLITDDGLDPQVAGEIEAAGPRVVRS